MVLRDFDAYVNAHDALARDYQNRSLWLEKAVKNTAMSAFFSSDRTINEYNEKIWHLDAIK